MRDTISLRNKATLRAGLGSIGGIDDCDRHTCQNCFVFDEGPELEEGPVMLSCPLLTPNCDSVSNATQVFKGDTETVPLRLRHNSLGDTMIGVPLIAGLLGANALELALSRTCSPSLKVTPSVGEDAPLPFHRFARISFPVRIYCQIDDAQVKAEEALGDNSFGFGGLDNLVEKEMPISIDQVSLFSLSQKGYIGPGLEGKAMPVEGHSAISLVGVVVDRDSPQGLEDSQGVASSLVAIGIGHLANGYSSLLPRQTELRTKPMIGPSLQGEPMEDTFLEGNEGHGVAGSVELPYHGEESGGLAP